MSKCDNILLDTLDFVIRVLYNNLMILVLNSPGPLSPVINLALLCTAYVQLTVVTLSLLLELKLLSL